jgi:hypothetical protein
MRLCQLGMAGFHLDKPLLVGFAVFDHTVFIDGYRTSIAD